jgi:hypothetical protein
METFQGNIERYNKLRQLFEENKDKSYKEWLDFVKVLDKPGKQGIVGLFRIKNTKYDIIFKLSQYINYLSIHEYEVMNGLNDVSLFCPHFCKTIGLIQCEIDAKFRDKDKKENPFVIENKYPITTDVILNEYISGSSKFYNYIRSEKISEEILYSIIKQILLAICIVQKKKKFSHYDLHSFNIMIKKCDEDLVFLYRIDEDNQFCIPTLGYYPVIIDFGFSYISNMDDSPLWPSLAHTDVGFLSDRFDWVADPKLFLVTVSDEIKLKKKTKKAKKFRRIVKNIFHPLKIDWESGWDEYEEDGVAHVVIKRLENISKRSDVFKYYDHYCIDIIQTLIILPMESQDSKNLESSFKAFLEEWIKIENEITNPFYSIYILKGIVDIARDIRHIYTNKETRIDAIRLFRQSIYEIIDKISKYIKIKNLHFEKLLCSLYVFSRALEGFMYETSKKLLKDKYKDYEKLPIKSTEQIFAVITSNLPDEYKYNKNTKILLIDNVSQTMSEHTLDKKEISNINEITHLARGTYINDIIMQNK